VDCHRQKRNNEVPTDEQLLKKMCEEVQPSTSENNGQIGLASMGVQDMSRRSYDETYGDKMKRFSRECSKQCNNIVDPGTGCTSGATEDIKNEYKRSCRVDCHRQKRNNEVPTDEQLLKKMCEEVQPSTSENNGQIGLASMGQRDNAWKRSVRRHNDFESFLRRRDAYESFLRRRDAIKKLLRRRDEYERFLRSHDMKSQDYPREREVRRNDPYNRFSRHHDYYRMA